MKISLKKAVNRPILGAIVSQTNNFKKGKGASGRAYRLLLDLL